MHQPNQKWVTDVTFIHTRQGWAFLSTIKDLHDGFIVAHYFTRQNSLGLVTKTLNLAIQKEVVTDGLVLHSDQGTSIQLSRVFCPNQRIQHLHLQCPDVEIAGIMLQWKTSLAISKKKPCANF